MHYSQDLYLWNGTWIQNDLFTIFFTKASYPVFLENKILFLSVKLSDSSFIIVSNIMEYYAELYWNRLKIGSLLYFRLTHSPRFIFIEFGAMMSKDPFEPPILLKLFKGQSSLISHEFINSWYCTFITYIGLLSAIHDALESIFLFL